MSRITVTSAIILLASTVLSSSAIAQERTHKSPHALSRAKLTQSATHATIPRTNPEDTPKYQSNSAPLYGSGGTCSPLPRFGKVEQARRLAEGGLPWCGGGVTNMGSP
jgi:hypothetical protein